MLTNKGKYGLKAMIHLAGKPPGQPSLVADLDRNRPDALLVGRLDTRFHQWLWTDPEIAAARADYRLYASEADSGFPAELWVRAELFGLRLTLPDGEVGKP